MRIANNATGASPRRHPRLAGNAGPRHLKDVVTPALPQDDYSLGAVRLARARHNRLLLARLEVRKAEREAHMTGTHMTECTHNLKVALERKRLADERYLAALAMLNSAGKPEGGPVLTTLRSNA